MKTGKISDPQGLVYRLGRKNVLINGALDIWQRGVSFAAIADGTNFADMWYHIKGTTAAAMTITRDTNVPTVAQAGCKFTYSMKCDVTTADASVASNDVVSLQTKVEGFDARHLADKICTLSFWVSSPKTGAHSVSIVSNGSNRVYPFTYTVNSANTWEKKTKTFTLDVAGGGTWAWDTSHAFKIRFPLMAGSDYANGTESTWGTTGLYGVTSGQANVMDSTDNNFYITGLQLELGSVATEFDFRFYSEELDLCQRYFTKSYEIGIGPGTATDGGRVLHQASYTGDYYCTIFLPKRMRPSATATIYSPSTGDSGKIRNYNSGADISLTSATFNETSILLRFTTVDTNIYGIQWIAESNL